MMAVKQVRKALEAFATLFTQSIEQQDLSTSLRSAAVAICLVTIEGFTFLIWEGVRPAVEIIGISLLVVLVWMAVTSIVARPEHRKLDLARNLSLISFWIAATLVLVCLAASIFPDPLDTGIRRLSAIVLIAPLVPVHLFRNMRSRPAALWWMIPALWTTMGYLAWHVFI